MERDYRFKKVRLPQKGTKGAKVKAFVPFCGLQTLEAKLRIHSEGSERLRGCNLESGVAGLDI